MTDDTAYPDLADRWEDRPMTAEQLRYAAAAVEWDEAASGLHEAASEAARITDAADARFKAAELELRACEISPGIPRRECARVA